MKSDSLIAESLVSILKAVNEEAVPEQWSTKKWTDTIKLKVSNLGQEMNLYTCCSSVESANWGEWLYDLCWLEYDNEGYLVQSKLIMESEWSKSNDQIIWDFQKLLLGKADIKVMVFQSNSFEKAKSTISKMKTFINRYSGIHPNETYLFAYWLESTYEFEYEIVRAKTSVQ